MSFFLVHSDRFAEHQTPPGHPESPERAEVMEAVARECRQRGIEVIAPPLATSEQLARVHDEKYLRQIAETSGRATALDADTYTSPETHEIALLAAGAGVAAVERVLNAKGLSSLALVRPPGHHAERNRAMGFCFYNNVAVAAAHARALGAARVAIVDYDVHHGNGTQHMFESDPSVLYMSTHQHPFYPGTGPADDVGHGAGRGYTVNLPLEAGAVDEDYKLAFEQVVMPILRQFKPSLVLVSAGFDAHERDPLAAMRLTTGAFAAMTTALRQVADEECDGRLVAMLEGGYDLKALGDSLHAAISSLTSPRAEAPRWPDASTVAPTRGRATIASAKRALSSFWKI